MGKTSFDLKTIYNFPILKNNQIHVIPLHDGTTVMFHQQHGIKDIKSQIIYLFLKSAAFIPWLF